MENNAKPESKTVKNLQSILGLRESGNFKGNITSRLYSSDYAVDNLDIKHAFKIENNDHIINSIQFNRDGNLLAGAYGKRIGVWEWEKPKTIFDFQPGRSAKIMDFKLLDAKTRGGLSVVSGCELGEVRVIDVPPSGGGQSLSSWVLFNHNRPIHKICPSPWNNNELLTISQDGQLRHFDLRSKKSTLLTSVERDLFVPITGLVHNPVAPEVCVYGRDMKVRIFDVRRIGTPLHYVNKPLSDKPLTNSVTLSAEYNKTGNELLVSYSNEYIYLYDTMDPSIKCLHTYRGAYRPPLAIPITASFFGLNDEFVMSGSFCGVVFMWNKETQEIVNVLGKNHDTVPHIVRAHPTLPYVAASNLNCMIKMFTPQPGQAKKMSAQSIADLVVKNEDVMDRRPRISITLSNGFCMEFRVPPLVCEEHEQNVFALCYVDGGGRPSS